MSDENPVSLEAALANNPKPWEEKTDASLAIKQVGKITFAPEGGPYGGCRYDIFNGVEEYNTFFETNLGLLVVAQTILADGSIAVLYTRTLDDDELEVLGQRGHIIENMLKDFRAEKAKRKEEEEKQALTDYEELKRLAEIGRHCEKSHGAVIKQLRNKGKK